MRLLYYITAHGYGHGVRSCTVINALSADVDVIVRSNLPAEFFAHEIHRPFVLEPAEFDCGCVQVDSLVIDVAQTIATYSTLAQHNRAMLPEEVRWTCGLGVDVIASDITPFAFDVAREAGIPSAAVTNFTWFDIYQPYVKQFPEFAPMVEDVRRQYASATTCLELTPCHDMYYFPHRQSGGVVGRTGSDRAVSLRRRFGMAASTRIGLIYPGNYGIGDMSWKGLERFTDWLFIGLYPLPGEPSNYRVVTKSDVPYQDLAASADLVVSKMGYATVAECMLNGVPLLYLPRNDFAEYDSLSRGVDAWGFGYCLSPKRYRALDWEGVLQSLPARGSIPRVPAGGAHTCARAIEALGRRD